MISKITKAPHGAFSLKGRSALVLIQLLYIRRTIYLLRHDHTREPAFKSKPLPLRHFNFFERNLYNSVDTQLFFK